MTSSLPAAWCGSAADLLTLDVAALSAGAGLVGGAGLAGPAAAWWRAAVPLLRAALPRLAAVERWLVVLDLRLLRLRRRIDAVLVTDRAVLAILVRPEARAFLAADRLAAEDAALDLADFHPGCRGLPVLPVLLVPNGARAVSQLPLPLAGAAPVLEATRLSFPALLRAVATGFPPLGHSALDWQQEAYAPVPALMEAACLLYAQHDVAAIALAQAGPAGVARAAAAVAAAVASAQDAGERLVVFVTGEPGAGKTLCGLDIAFRPGLGAAFLTGNPTLVHVLREALLRDCVGRGADRRRSRRLVEAVIQSLPGFRDHHLGLAAPPPERLVVIDEAQRCWSSAHAIGKTRNRALRLTDSEPGHLLDIMGRRPGWAVLICLLGGGQEIHDGEGGLAAWGEALRARPDWRALAPEAALHVADPRQRLSPWPGLACAPDLHLQQPVRAVGAPMVASWVDAVLADAPARAAAIAARAGGAPFQVTRSLSALREALRPRGTRRSGLVASSGARRLRAEGLGAVLPHQDDDAVARWFLDRWPDVRSSDALEVTASEFGVQGLELDRVGLCWDADLVRAASQGWEARRFRANTWTRAGAEARANRLNAYRVLLTRARHGTVIWVPRGCPRDPTRDPARYDAVAAYLLRCGAGALDAAGEPAETAPAELQEPVLL